MGEKKGRFSENFVLSEYVCEREREREKQRETKRQTDR